MLTLLAKALLWALLLPLTVTRWALGRVRRRAAVLEVVLEGPHPERAAPKGLRGGPAGVSRMALRRALREAALDPRIEQVRVRVGPLGPGWAEAWTLRRLLQGARDNGLRVQAFLATSDLRSLWVASASDELVCPPHQPIEAGGLAVRMTFFAEALGRAGVEVEALAAGDYKSAMEPFTRTGPSGPNREALEALLGDLDGQVVADLAAARRVDPQVIREVFAEAPLRAADALRLGLVDRLASEDEVFDPEADERTLDADGYPGRPSPWPRIRFRRPKLAVVDLRGTIKDGRALDPAPAGAVPRALAGALAKARRSKRIKGVLLAIDSPGGSATASEAMWRAVRRLAAKKPVIAVMGDMAASGGYYVAAACDGIVAAPTTLTGSIGVIAARPSVQGLLHHLGLYQHTLGPGPRAQLMHPGKPLTQAEREALMRTVDDFYEVFLSRVAEGRDRTPESVEPVAQGRVWSGQQALAHGLVDRLGDERDGLAWLAERAGLDAVPDRIAYITPPRTLRAAMRRLLSAQSPALPDAVAEPLALWRQVAEQPLQAWCPWRVD